jgi:hypothetical protein
VTKTCNRSLYRNRGCGKVDNFPVMPDETPQEWSKRVLAAYGERFPDVDDLRREATRPISPPKAEPDPTLEELVDTLKALQPRRRKR